MVRRRFEVVAQGKEAEVAMWERAVMTVLLGLGLALVAVAVAVQSLVLAPVAVRTLVHHYVGSIEESCHLLGQ